MSLHWRTKSRLVAFGRKMAAGRGTVEMVKKALYVQSHGGAVGRFYVQRTLDHLQQCHDYFKEDVKEIKAIVPSHANHAFRRFIFENVPQLKYRNPQTTFNCNLRDESSPELKVVFADGNETIINIEQKQSDIYNAVIDVTKDNTENILHKIKDENL